MNDFYVIFDNGGGVSVQTSEDYFFFGDEHEAAAESVAALLNGETTELWDGNAPENRLDYDADQVDNGGYQWWDADDLRKALRDGCDSGWYNVRNFLQLLAQQ